MLRIWIVHFLAGVLMVADGAEAPPPVVEIAVGRVERPARVVTRRHFGLVGRAASDPAVAEDERYQKALAYLAPGYFRVVGGRENWLLEDGRSWDADRVLRSIRAVQQSLPAASEITVVIDRWPDWMDADGDGRLDAERQADFGAHCADLVAICHRLEKPVGGIEVTEGLDAAYEIAPRAAGDPSRALELAELLSWTVLSIREVWPEAPVMAPGARAVDNAPFHRGLALSLSFGGYAAYSVRYQAESAAWGAGPAAALGEVAAILALQPQPMDFVLSEVAPPDLEGMRSAAWDAWLAVVAIKAGCDAVAAGSDSGGNGARLGPDLAVLPSGHLMRLANTMLAGKLIAECELTGASEGVAVLAMREGRGPTVLLVNGNPDSRIVELGDGAWEATHSLTVEGIEEAPLAGPGRVELPGYGVMVVR